MPSSLLRWSLHRFVVACFCLTFGQAALAQSLVLGWHSNLEDACQLAEKNGKPLFITFRCVRCPECLAWDGQVSQEDVEIATLRKEFVCVRITSMNGVNLRRFEFDYDATWTAFFTDSRLNVYSRYGGRDQGDPEARLSKPSLLHTMREVLRVNESVHTARANGQDTASFFQPVPADVAKPEDMPLLEKNNQGCVHCHLVREYSLLQAYHDGRFRRDLLFTFPLPETLGMEIDRQHGHRAAKVQPDSVAASCGMKAGDEVVQINGVPIRSELDIRWSLHRLPLDMSRVTVQVRREPSDAASANPPIRAQFVTVELKLPPRWREGELGWRKSSRSIPMDWSFRGAAMTETQRREGNLPLSGLALNVLSVTPSGFAGALDLQKYDVILALNGDTRERSLEQLRSDLLRRFTPGDEVRLTIRRAEQTMELKGQFPGWFTEKTSVP